MGVLVTCKVCSEDEYTSKGLCSGSWYYTNRQIRDGRVLCRCNSNNHRWTRVQREYQVATKLTGFGSFVKWEDDTFGVKSYLYWRCHCGNEQRSRLTNLLHKGDKCNSCRSWGFNIEAPANIYLVRWRDGSDYSCLKFGITNRDPFRRIYEQASKSSMEWELLINKRYGKGKLALSWERCIKNLIETSVCPKNKLPDGWTETCEDNTSNLETLVRTLEVEWGCLK